MFLKNLDNDRYAKAVDSTTQRVEHCLVGFLLILLKLPGIAATISQHNTVENKSTVVDYTTQQSTEGISDIVNVASACTGGNSRWNLPSNCQPTKNNKFEGNFHACDHPNHHTCNCFFLKKIKKSLLYLKNNKNTVGKSTTKHYCNMGQYQQHHDKIRSLQDGNFILPTLDPYDFLDIVDDLVINTFLCQEIEDNDQPEWFYSNDVIHKLVDTHHTINDVEKTDIGDMVKML